jgi:hypothetical protein
MKLDRNINGNGRGKYGLVKNRRLQEIIGPIGDSRNAKNMDKVNRMKVREAVQLLVEEGVIDWGTTPETEFFPIMLKDCYAEHALTAYALAARKDDSEYARDVANLAQRSGRRHPHCKRPD